MPLKIQSYHFYTGLCIFFTSIFLSIQFDNYLFFCLPFIWLIFPAIVKFCVYKTEKLFWFLIFFLPLSTEINIIPSLGIDFPDELFMMLFTGLIILKFLHEPKWFPANLKTEPLFLLLICIMAWTLISACFAENPMLAVKFFLARIWYIFPFVIMPQILLRSQTSIQKLVYYLLVPMLFVVVQTLVRHSFYGFSFVDIKKTVSPFFRNHVNYSSMLVCLFVPAFAIRFLMGTEHRFTKWVNLGILIGILGLFFSYSRGAWVALIIGIVFAFLMEWNWVKKMAMLVLVIFIMACSWLFVDNHYLRFAPDHDRTIFHTDFSEHIAATISMKDVSNAERFYRWVAGVRMFAQRPLTGFGANNFYSNYGAYTLNSFETWVSNNPEHSSIHNYFLLTLAEQGVPGLLLLISLWLGMLFRLQYLYQRLQSRFYRIVSICTASILAMIMSINFMSDMIETDKIGSLFWLCLGFVFILNQQLKEEQQSLA